MYQCNNLIDYVDKKDVKKLHCRRFLSRAGVEPRNIIKDDVATIRPVLEYAAPIWQAIPEYLSRKIESIQKRALRIIYPLIDSYDEATSLANIPTLKFRREQLCKRYMIKMKNKDHPLHMMLPKCKTSQCSYRLRNEQNNIVFFNNICKCKTLRTEQFFTFKYF